MTGHLSDKLFREFERAEIRVWNQFFKFADEDAIRSCGIDVDSEERLAVLIASKLDILAMNRVIGLGLYEPATEEKIEYIISRYKDAGVPRFFIQPQRTMELRSAVQFCTEIIWISTFPTTLRTGSTTTSGRWI